MYEFDLIYYEIIFIRDDWPIRSDHDPDRLK